MLGRNTADERSACELVEIVDRADPGQKIGALKQTGWPKTQKKYPTKTAKNITCMVKHKSIPNCFSQVYMAVQDKVLTGLPHFQIAQGVPPLWARRASTQIV